MSDRDPRFDQSRREEAARLYRDERLSMREVAARMGVSVSRVHALLKDAGVRSRSRRRRPAKRVS